MVIALSRPPWFHGHKVEGTSPLHPHLSGPPVGDNSQKRSRMPNHEAKRHWQVEHRLCSQDANETRCLSSTFLSQETFGSTRRL